MSLCLSVSLSRSLALSLCRSACLSVWSSDDGEGGGGQRGHHPVCLSVSCRVTLEGAWPPGCGDHPGLSV
eukprot:2229412-Rhodomonas_salina.1